MNTIYQISPNKLPWVYGWTFHSKKSFNLLWSKDGLLTVTAPRENLAITSGVKKSNASGGVYNQSEETKQAAPKAHKEEDNPKNHLFSCLLQPEGWWHNHRWRGCHLEQRWRKPLLRRRQTVLKPPLLSRHLNRILNSCIKQMAAMTSHLSRRVVVVTS